MTSCPSHSTLDPAVLQTILPSLENYSLGLQTNIITTTLLCSMPPPPSALWLSLRSQGTCLPNTTLPTQPSNKFWKKQQYATAEHSNSETTLLWATATPFFPGFLLISIALPQSPFLRQATNLVAMPTMGTLVTNGSLYGMCPPFHKTLWIPWLLPLFLC